MYTELPTFIVLICFTTTVVYFARTDTEGRRRFGRYPGRGRLLRPPAHSRSSRPAPGDGN